MPRVQWALRQGRPCVEVVLTLAVGDQPLPRILLADTGAGATTSAFELILDDVIVSLRGGAYKQSAAEGSCEEDAIRGRMLRRPVLQTGPVSRLVCKSSQQPARAQRND